jgi:uncharacterized protein
MIAEELRRHLAAPAAETKVVDVRIGLGYTAVMLDGGHVGLAYTFRDKVPGGCSAFSGPRPIAGRPAAEVLAYLGSADGVEASLGLAVSNALSNRPTPTQEEGDILELLPVRPDDRVGMVGFFGPLVAPLEGKVRDLLIFERDAGRSSRTLPAEEAYRRLPECQVAVITSTALLLGDLDRLLEAAGGCREVALVGPSTPLVPEVLGPLGVTLLSGMTVNDGPGILQVVSEGGGTGYFGKRVRKVNVRI